MIQLLLNRDDYVSAWLMSKIPDINFFDCKAIGIIKNQKLIAGVAYHNLRDGQIEASIALQIRTGVTEKYSMPCLLIHSYNADATEFWLLSKMVTNNLSS